MDMYCRPLLNQYIFIVSYCTQCILCTFFIHLLYKTLNFLIRNGEGKYRAKCPDYLLELSENCACTWRVEG